MCYAIPLSRALAIQPVRVKLSGMNKNVRLLVLSSVDPAYPPHLEQTNGRNVSHHIHLTPSLPETAEQVTNRFISSKTSPHGKDSNSFTPLPAAAHQTPLKIPLQGRSLSLSLIYPILLFQIL